MKKKETNPDIIKERYYKQLKRQKEYNSKKYDNIGLIVPAGCKEKIKEIASKNGYKSISEFVRKLISDFSGVDI